MDAWTEMLTRLARGGDGSSQGAGDGGVYVEDGGTFRLVEDDEELESMLR